MTTPPALTLHAWQSPGLLEPQPLLQQTPSAHCPLLHWDLLEQAAPLASRVGVLVTVKAAALVLLAVLDSQIHLL